MTKAELEAALAAARVPQPPPPAAFDLTKMIGAVVMAAVSAAGAARYGETERVEKAAKLAVSEVIEFRVNDNATAIAALRAELAPLKLEFIEVKTKIAAGLDRVIEKSDEARTAANSSSQNVQALKGEIDSVRQECRKCGR